MLSIFLVSVIMITITYFYTIRELGAKRDAVESQISRIAQNIATMQLLDQQDWSVYQNYITQLMAFNKDIVFIAIYDDRNTLRAHTLNTNLIELEQPVLSRRVQSDIVRRLDAGAVSKESREDFRKEQVNIQIGDRILGSVRVGFSIFDINRELRRGIQLNIGLAVFFIIIFSGISIYISQRLTRPLEELSAAMAAVKEGQLDKTVKTSTRDEIAELTESFNDMIEGLRERKIIEVLGYELSATFQIENLGFLVRERLKNAIGASGARLYIQRREEHGIFYEISVPEEQKGNYPPIYVYGEEKSFILQNKRGFMVHSAPENVMNTLRHSKEDEAGLLMPMMVKGELFGLLFFALSSGKNTFSEKEIHFASTLANQAALALENALLYEDLRDQERLKREIEIAQEVQRKLLPTRMPEIEGFQIDGICKPAHEVGGDYFDFFRLDEHNLGIVIADVSGKGTSASFYMAELKGMMMQLTSTFRSPKLLLSELNTRLSGNMDRKMFITMIYGVFNFSENKFTFSRAGHNSLLKIGKNGHHRFITPSGIGLGLDFGGVFEKKLEEVYLELKWDEAIILYTDGITEAMNSDQDEFGEERLLDSSLAFRESGVVALRKGILNSLDQFLDGSTAHDDITMVLIKHSG
jgi:serine phosphatase RsbU (regulator of sigma subunit)/HAMP domain-containing protein